MTSLPSPSSPCSSTPTTVREKSLTASIDLTSSVNFKWLKTHSGIGLRLHAQSGNNGLIHLSAHPPSTGHQIEIISPREFVGDRVAEQHTTGNDDAATSLPLDPIPSSSSYLPLPQSGPPSRLSPRKRPDFTLSGEMGFPTHAAFSPFPDSPNPYVGAVIFEGFLYGLYTTLFFICAYVLIRRHHRLSQRDAAERANAQLQSSSRRDLHSSSPNNQGPLTSPSYSTHNFSPLSANYSQSQTQFITPSNQNRNANNYTPPRTTPKKVPQHLPWIWVLLASGLLMYLIASADMIYTLVLLFRRLLGPDQRLTFEEIRIKYWLFVTNNMIADSLLLYRCYVVWTWRKTIVVGPGILLIGATAVGYTFEGSRSSLFGKTWIYLTLIVILNVLLTGLTAGRIWYLAHKAHAILRPGLIRRYNATIAILIESGVIYSAYILLNIGFNQNKVANVILDAGFIQIVGIMPTLIIVQVGVGRAVHDFETSEGVNMNPSRFDDDRDVPGHNEMETFDRTAQTFRSLRTGLKTSEIVDHEIDLEVGDGSQRASRRINRRSLMLQPVSDGRNSHLSVESAYRGLVHGRHSRSSGEDDIYDTPLATPTTPTIKLGHVDGDGTTPPRGPHHNFSHNQCTCRGNEDRYASHETFVVCRLHPSRYHSRNFSDGGSTSAFGGATMIAGSSTPNLRSVKSFKTADMGTPGNRNSFISRLGLPEFVVDDEQDRHYNHDVLSDHISEAENSNESNGLGLNLGVDSPPQDPLGLMVPEPQGLATMGFAISEDNQASLDQDRPRSGYVQGEGAEYAFAYDRLRPPSSHSRGSRSPGPSLIQLEATSSSETQRPITYDNPGPTIITVNPAEPRTEETDEDDIDTDMDIVDFESARSQLPPSSALFEGSEADWADVRSSASRPRSSGSRPSTSRNVSDSTTLSTDIYVEAPSRPISGTGSGFAGAVPPQDA